MVQPENLSTPRTVILTGPTAVGKSSLAIHVAQLLKQESPPQDLEIINADSVCFYQEFNIGSAKPSPEEQNQVVHHLLDVASPLDHYHVANFLRDFE